MRQDVFLAEMGNRGPWAESRAVIEPFCPKASAAHERMLPVDFLQWHAPGNWRSSVVSRSSLERNRCQDIADAVVEALSSPCRDDQAAGLRMPRLDRSDGARYPATRTGLRVAERSTGAD